MNFVDIDNSHCVAQFVEKKKQFTENKISEIPNSKEFKELLLC